MATKKTNTKTTKTTKTAEPKKEYAPELFCLWKNTGKNGKTYYSNADGVVGFYEKNPEGKRPNMSLCNTDDNGKLVSVGGLWIQTSKAGRKYFSGNYDGEKVIAFPVKSENEKAPAIRVYSRSVLDEFNNDQQKLDDIVEEGEEF